MTSPVSNVINASFFTDLQSRQSVSEILKTTHKRTGSKIKKAELPTIHQSLKMRMS